MLTLRQKMIWLIFVSSFFFLSSCVGSGTKSYSDVNRMIDNSQKRTVFVARDTGFVGSGGLVAVLLNGEEVGKLGDGESLAAIGRKGFNNLTVRFTGLASFGMNKPEIDFELQESENKYFIIDLDVNLLTPSKLDMFQVGEAQLRSWQR